MGWRFLLSAGIVHLLVVSTASQFESSVEDRFVQSFSPDLYSADAGDSEKPQLSFKTSDVRFNRASVEAAPDTIEVPSFTQRKADAYNLEPEETQPFSRQFIESGSLKPYGAASLARYSSPVNPVAYLYLQNLPQSQKYYGAAKPYLSYQSYRAFPAVPTELVIPTGEVAHPLRSAVEQRPVSAATYTQARSMDLADLRRKYEATHDQPFQQARQDPNHRAGSKHYESLSEAAITRSKLYVYMLGYLEKS